MEKCLICLRRQTSRRAKRQAIIGVIASGNLEVLLERGRPGRNVHD